MSIGEFEWNGRWLSMEYFSSAEFIGVCATSSKGRIYVFFVAAERNKITNTFTLYYCTVQFRIFYINTSTR